MFLDRAVSHWQWAVGGISTVSVAMYRYVNTANYELCELYTLPKRSQITMECRRTGVCARAPYSDIQSGRKQWPASCRSYVRKQARVPTDQNSRFRKSKWRIEKSCKELLKLRKFCTGQPWILNIINYMRYIKIYSSQTWYRMKSCIV